MLLSGNRNKILIKFGKLLLCVGLDGMNGCCLDPVHDSGWESKSEADKDNTIKE